MAGATKRTSVALGVLALVFVIIIVILCLVPRPCTGPHCKYGTQKAVVGGRDPTTAVTTSSSTSTTEKSTTPTTKKSTTSTEKSTTPTTKATTLVPSTTEKSTVLSSTDKTTTEEPSTTLKSTTLSLTSERSSTVPSTSETSSSLSSADTSSTLSSTTEDHHFLSSTSERSTTESSTLEGSTIVSTTTEESTADRSATASSTTEDTTTVSSTTESTTISPTADTSSTLSSTTSETTSYITSEEATMSSSTTEDKYLSSSTSEESTSATTEESTTLSSTTEETTTMPLITEGSTTVSTTTTDESSTSSSTTSETTYLTSGESTTESTTTEWTTTGSSTTESSTTDESTTLFPTFKETLEECNTTRCKRLASKMLRKMDHGDVQPCEDFYQYSCGGVVDDPFLDPENQQLLAENLIRESLMRVYRNDSLLGPVRVFYDSCVNHTKSVNETYRLEQTKNIFSSVGYDYEEDTLIDFDEGKLTQLLAKMMKMHFTPLFDLLLDVDGNDTTKFAFKLTPPLFTSPFSDDLGKAVCFKHHQQRLEEARLKKLTVDINNEYEIYTQCMLKGRGLQVRLERMEDAVRNMKLMGHIVNETVQEKLLLATKFNANFFIESVVEFLPNVPELRKGSLKKQYQEFTLQDLDDGKVFSSSVIVWKNLVRELLGYDVDPSSVVQVYFQDELNNILETLQVEFTDDSRNLQNMLLLMWSERIFTDLVKPVGAALDSPKYCYRVTTTLMEDFTSYLYLKALPDLPIKQEQIQRIIKQEKAVAKTELKRTFKSQSNNALVRKLQLMTGEVAELDESEQALQANIQGITLNDNFIENSKTLIERYRTLMYRVYDKSPDNPQVMWSQFHLPYSPYGKTSYALNKFLVPYAALGAPLFYDDGPSYINYAGIGHMIAHEIAHGFDGTGVFYNGLVKQRMNEAAAYVGVTEHIQEQLQYPQTFSSASGLTSKFKLYPGLALNEVIADSAATRLAWETYYADVTSSLTTTPASVPVVSGRGTEFRRRRSLDLYPSGSPWSTRWKRQVPPPYLPPLASPELRLPWLGLTPAQLYFLRIAQNQCSKSSEVSMLTVMENEHLPPRLRVNLVFKNEPLFAEAFNCKVGSAMKPRVQFPFVLG